MQCIVLTDSERLSAKYRASRKDVLQLLQRNLMDQNTIECLLLDAADYRDELGEDPSWYEYKAIVGDFMLGMGLKGSPKLSLFIIGGDDVIPMPRMQSPIDEDDILQCDFLYCFKADAISRLDADSAWCHVGRLPLEGGSLPSSLQDDLQSYFNLAGMMLPTGIEVGNVLMTSTQSWLPASNEMIRGLPVDPPNPIAEATKENMYTSPLLAVDENTVVKQYLKDIGEAEMLMFNLHGSSTRNYSSFYGEGANGHNTPEAFTIDYLHYSGARIFNTVACYGGRFIQYKRSESMLLSSLYGGGVVLYAGSCTSALGRSGVYHNTARDMLVPAGMSESFMKLYTLYLFKGIPAGEAFLRAKCDYFNTCRGLDGDEAALATVLMFNLYGMPALHVIKRDEVTQEAQGMKMAMPVDMSARLKYETVYDKNKDTVGILGQVRSMVNDNLSKIRQTVETQLYQTLGLPPSDLSSIATVTKGKALKGYRFEYRDDNELIPRRHWAYTDLFGKLKDVVHFK